MRQTGRRPDRGAIPYDWRVALRERLTHEWEAGKWAATHDGEEAQMPEELR